MNKEMREKAIKELVVNLGCTLDIAGNILSDMDKEAKEQQEVFNECACEMA
jgi:hypothetical protein